VRGGKEEEKKVVQKEEVRMEEVNIEHFVKISETGLLTEEMINEQVSSLFASPPILFTFRPKH
jgi:hypothetical protein